MACAGKTGLNQWLTTNNFGCGRRPPWERGFEMGRTMQAGMVALVFMVASGQGATKTWNNDNGNGSFVTADNWVEDAAPVSGVDSVILDPNAGTAWFASEFTIASGQSMTSSTNGVAMRIGPGGDLTVATGGALDFSISGASLAENGVLNQRTTFEAGATVTLAALYTSSGWTMEFIADAGGVTKVDVSSFSPSGPLELDLTNYDTANGSALILFDYSGGVAGVFSSTNVTGAPADGSVNYAYDQGGGDMGIAYVLDIPYQWEGDGVDSNWMTAANWNFNAVPGASDTVVVGAGHTVTNVPDSYGSLLIEAGASVTMAGTDNAWNGQATTVEGILDFAGAFRLYGSALLHVSGSLGTNMNYLVPYQNATVRFTDGASLEKETNFQLDDNPTLEFMLSETGFSTLKAGQLSGNALWSNVTFHIDISKYDRYLGTDVTLMDFSASGFGGTFDPDANSPTVDITGHSGGSLSWDAVNHDLILEMEPPPPRGAVFVIR